MDLKAQILQEGINVPDDFFHNVQIYKELLLKWNKIHNLTGAKDEKKLDEFIYDAVFPVRFLPHKKSLMDIGTGAGFPGMILAFALPDTKVTLVEPLAKRASFLQFIKADLKLDNVEVKKCRVEELENQTFDIITSRAVTETKMLLELSRPFRKESTMLLFYKGEKVYDEVDGGYDHEVIKAHNRHYLIIKNIK
ncbi:16S rRNA (guanine(527)-N(7))-methyltransferase RsmG [Sulfurimonas sp. HSL-1716]|uniref:16S rRNA (guanine(527)-N(7))-methyltransferase RsmG n=1 Tax=Hydrocurvibacter sulfurireducens TaxID=3131937 RepID=UPI0031F925F2